MAHKKAAGSAKNLRDSNPKYRWVKLFGGQVVEAGNIIIRQKWSKYLCGVNTYMGKDFTVHAKIDGIVIFSKKKVKKFNWRTYIKTVVDVATEVQKATAVAKKASVKKIVAKKPAAKESVAKKASVKKVAAKKLVVKKAPAKK